jgi:hypothetical protein
VDLTQAWKAAASDATEKIATTALQRIREGVDGPGGGSTIEGVKQLAPDPVIDRWVAEGAPARKPRPADYLSIPAAVTPFGDRRARWLVYAASLLSLLSVVLLVDALCGDQAVRYRLVGVVLAVVGFSLAAALGLGGMRVHALLRRLLFALTPVAGLLLLCEGTMRLCGVGDSLAVVVVADDGLGHVLAPGHGDADLQGFRNPGVPSQADVVFLGDSQVYGFGLDAAQAMPRVFEGMTASTAYSMSLGGYGAIQYRELARQALPTMHPDALVVGFYFGNDLVDAYLHAHLQVAADLRRPGCDYPVHSAVAAQGQDAPNLAMALVGGFVRSSRLLTMARAVALRIAGGGSFWGDEQGVPAWQSGAIATRFTPTYRLAALDPDDAGVVEGLRITRQCLADIAAECAAAGVRCLFVPLHTKEYCYRQFDLVAATGESTITLRRLHDAESTARAELLSDAAAAGMEVVDPTAAFLGALSEDRPMWHATADGHLNAEAHACVAGMVGRALGRIR